MTSCLVVAAHRINPGARGSLTQQLLVLALVLAAAVLVGREMFYLGSLEWIYLVAEMVFGLCAVLAMTSYCYARILVHQSPR